MPIVNIPIANYKPFYIQYGENTTATDTKAAWGMVAKTNPYPLLPSPKATYKNDWKDEDGDDEYTTHLHYQAFEMEVEFYMKATAGSGVTAASALYTSARAFFTAVKDGEFKIFDSYTGIGFQKVRYAGYEEDSFKERNGVARAIFTVKFKVNDPTTVMVMSNGAIVEA